MRIVKGHKLHRDGSLGEALDHPFVRLEEPRDYDRLLANILEGGLYDQEYFAGHGGLGQRHIPPERLHFACLLACLKPKSLMDLGCGSGDIPLLVKQIGLDDLALVDISPELPDEIWPDLRGSLHIGDFPELARTWSEQGRRFDLLTAFDIWEHLHPKDLEQYIDAVRGLAAPKALFVFVVPAVGPDPVFGEVFPLDVAENREDFQAGRPLSHLPLVREDPPVPWDGHLILASAPWWEERFTSRGLVRAPFLESCLHRAFDAVLGDAQRCFFIFRLDTQEGAARAARLAAEARDRIAAWRAELALHLALARQVEADQPLALSLNDTAARLFHLARPGGLDDSELQRAGTTLTELFLAGREVEPRLFPFALQGFLCQEHWATDSLVWADVSASIRLGLPPGHDRRYLLVQTYGWRASGYEPEGLELTIKADGKELKLVRYDNGRFVFALPGRKRGIAELAFCCTPFVPAEFDGGDDQRRLGLDIMSLTLLAAKKSALKALETGRVPTPEP